MLGLAKVLDSAPQGKNILLASFGSGAGSDAFFIRTTDLIEEKRDKLKPFETYANRKEYINYATYVKFRKKLKV